MSDADQRRRLTVALYVVSAFLYWASLYLYVPTLSVFAQTRTDSLALVGIILSMYGLWQAVVRIPLGIAADWLGRRKPFIIAGVALSALGAILMALSGDANGLIVGRAVTGLAAGAWVPMVAVFSTLFPPEDAVRASAMLTLVASAARAVATSVNGTLNNAGGYSLAFWVAAIAAALAILTLLPSRERRRLPNKPSLPAISRLLVRKDVLLPGILQAVGQYADWTVTFGFLPVLAKRLGASDVALSLLVSMNIGVVLLGNVLSASAVRRFGAHRLVRIAFLFVAAGIAGAALARSLALIFTAQALSGLGQGMAYPLLMGMSIERVADEQRTTAMGLHQAVYALGMFGGPWLSGRLAEAVGIRPTFAVTALVCLVLGLAGTWWLSYTGAKARRSASALEE